MKKFITMFETELKLALRNLDVPIFGIIFPLFVAFVLASISKQDNQTLSKIFAATLTISIAANGLMGLPLTLSTYRSDKVLKQWKVSPISSFLILMVQFMVKFFLCVISAVLIAVMLQMIFDFSFTGQGGEFLFGYFLTIFAIFGIGMIIASVSPNANTTNLLCSIVYFPMLFLSGATIPLEILPKSIVRVLQILPMTQGVDLLESVAAGQSLNASIMAIAYLLVIGILSVLVSTKCFKWE